MGALNNQFSLNLSQGNILYLYKEIMNSILRICVPSTLRVVAQHTKILTICLDLILDILKQPTFHDQVHYSLRVENLFN